ncbi:hypothetical protein [Streptomyces sp. NPDC059378]|uniref:hypothetical protein n=1 Tax=Streptomyces sp. NPDC059378 TaxID=3346815 RepID=UPI0036A3841F
MAPTLLWLAHRHLAAYARAAIALLLCVTAGLVFAESASVCGLRTPEASAIGDYAALPGVFAGWYLLTGLAWAAGFAAVRAGIAAVAVAVSADSACVLNADNPVHGAVWAAGVPLVAWYVAGRIQRPGAHSRGHTDVGDSDGRVVPFPPRGGAMRQGQTTASLPPRKAA